MAAAKIYFVLYVVLLCELFLVILDRDEAQDAWLRYIENQDPLCEVKYSNTPNDSNYLPFPPNESQITIAYHLYAAGFISSDEINSTKLTIHFNTRNINNRHNWDGTFLSVSNASPKDTVTNSSSGSTMILEKSSDNVYTLGISYNQKFIETFKQNLSDRYDTLFFTSFFQIKGRLPIDPKSKDLKNTILTYMKNNKTKFPNLYRVTNEDSIITSRIYNFKFIPIKKGISPGDHG